MKNKKLYLLPGLAFDHRIFQNLNLEGYDVEFIDWIDPFQNETIVQIHGDKDKTFPIHLIENPTAVVKNAGHFMVFKQPETISQLIKENLN